MFENLRTAFSNAAKSFGEKELKEKDIEDILFQLEISLLESDVATEVIDSIKSDLKEKLIGTKVNKNEIENFVKTSLIETISNLFDAAGKVDLIENISSKKESGQPYIILFVGINGTGKTTTLAKLAYLLKNSKLGVVVAASDTFRAGAIEQLREHTNRLNLKLVAQNYGSDPAAVARDAVLYAQSHKIDCVLIDTAGRMQTSKNLMEQMAKITNVVKPDFKIFVGDSLAGNDTVNQARVFYEHTKFDGAILTKSDADARGGAALSIVKVVSKPIMYVGVGQEYQDLISFDKDVFLEKVFGTKEIPATEGAPKEPLEQETTELETTEPEPEPEPEPELEIKKEPEPELEIKKEPEPQPEPKIEQAPKLETPKKETMEKTDEDPFEGIDDKDINRFADLYDVPPPENDKQARELASKIKSWISKDRPKPGETPTESKEHSKEASDETQKSKKKRSLFGGFRN